MSPPTWTLVEPLATYAQRAGDILKEYVAIHDELLARRLLLFFRPFDFEALVHRLNSLARELTEIQGLTAAFQSNHPARDLAEPALADFTRFIPALLQTIALLTNICDRLAEKKRGTRPYTWREYRSQLREYDASVEVYVSLGDCLNRSLVETTQLHAAELREPSEVHASEAAGGQRKELHIGVLYSLRKSWRLWRLSKPLAQPIRDTSKKDRALEALLDLCNADPAVGAVMAHFNRSREDLRTIYWDLMVNGAGQRAGLHWVPASTIAFGNTLQFYLDSELRIPIGTRIVLLIEYFARNDAGPVPTELRGPADPSDPLSALWKIEQRVRRERER